MHLSPPTPLKELDLSPPTSGLFFRQDVDGDAILPMLA
jgi:hypothetical protein